MTADSPVVLEPAAQQVADAFSKPPFVYEMAPADARQLLEGAPSSVQVTNIAVDEEWITVPSLTGDVRVRIIRPQNATGMLPVIVYMQGGGWILGNAGTHDRLVRELAARAARTIRAHLTGGDPYSFTAPMLAWAAGRAAADGVRPAGALRPVEAFGLGSLETACADARFHREAADLASR